MAEVTASIISVGDELLIGQTVNTNAAWMGGELSAAGIRPVHVSTIRDDKSTIIRELENASCDIILMTGGLGPTQDDITKDALCAFFETKLEQNDEVLDRVGALFKRIGRPVLEENRKQALLPKSCTIIPNQRGTASGMWFEKDGMVFVSMPGVPYEMKAMMTDTIIPRLVERFNPPRILHRTILTTGLGESHLAERIKDQEKGLEADGIGLAYLPSPGIVKLRMSKYGAVSADEALIEKHVKALQRLIPDLIFGEGEQSLAQVVGELLKQRGETLGTAESCTGGFIAHSITAIPGSSAYFQGAVVSYANEVKMRSLGVTEEVLTKHGAVSEQVVRQMAEGAKKHLGSTWAIATSGIAGPDGGTEEKPVGMVWIAVSGPPGTRAIELHFPGARTTVIKRSTHAALNALRKQLIRGE